MSYTQVRIFVSSNKALVTIVRTVESVLHSYACRSSVEVFKLEFPNKEQVLKVLASEDVLSSESMRKLTVSFHKQFHDFGELLSLETANVTRYESKVAPVSGTPDFADDVTFYIYEDGVVLDSNLERKASPFISFADFIGNMKQFHNAEIPDFDDLDEGEGGSEDSSEEREYSSEHHEDSSSEHEPEATRTPPEHEPEAAPLSEDAAPSE